MSQPSPRRPPAPATRDAMASGGAEQLQSLTPGSARELFAGLPSPGPGDLFGRWEGHIVGRKWLRWANQASALFTPLWGWCGKEFDASGEVRNLVRRHDEIRPSVGCRVSSGPSVVDGHPALIVDYAGSGPPPVAWLRGEVRWLAPGTRVFGLLMLRPGGRTVMTFPFVMTRSPRG